MIYSFSFLLILLGLVMCIPAIRRLLNMQDINRNSATTQGQVLSSSDLVGRGTWAAGLGNLDRSLIRYYSPSDTEMVLEVRTKSILPITRYEAGQALEITYDKASPGRAYITEEWKNALRDLWLGAGALFVGVMLWIIGRVYNLPF